VYKLGEFTPHNTFLHTTLNSRFGVPPGSYAYQAVHTLKQLLIDKLAEQGISDTKSDEEREKAAR
jgi:hypothetical protein